MKINRKRYNTIHRTLMVMVMGTLTFPSLVLAEAGAKSMFADEGTSVMMGDDVGITKTSYSKPKAKVRVVSERTPHQSISNGIVDTGPVNYAGLQYWIDLQDANGHSRQVTTGYTFHSGDGIKLKIKSKTAGYLYVLNQDASGQKTPLYPTKGRESGLIDANMTYTIPPSGLIRFDSNPGNEKVTIALSKYPIIQSNSDSSDTSARATTASYDGQSVYSDCTSSGAGSKGMYAEENNSSSIDCIRNNHSAGSKGMFAEEDTSSAEPASYSVIPSSVMEEGKVLFIDFILNHR
jgi:hypothetical protein